MSSAGAEGEPGGSQLAERTQRRLAVWLPAAVIVLAGIFLLLSSFGPLGNGLWYDEWYSVHYYLNSGPSAVWGNYVPGDHMLWELLTWATVSITGDHSNEAYRLWGVFPSVASVALLSWWAWRRLGRWVAASFAVLAATAPIHQTLGFQARGFGIAFLAGAIVLIGADLLLQSGGRRGWWVLTGGSLLGMLTLPVFAVPVAVTAVILFTRHELRRRLALIGLGVAVFLAVWYGPVIGAAIRTKHFAQGSPLPLHSVFSTMLQSLILPSVNLVATNLSLGSSEIIGGCVLVAGLVALWLRTERYLAVLTILPPLAAFVGFSIGPVGFADRFTSYLLLWLLVPCAFLFGDIGRRLAAFGALPRIALSVAGVVAGVLMLSQGAAFYRSDTGPPIEAWSDAAQIVKGDRRVPAITNSTNLPQLHLYDGGLGRAFGAGRVASQLCSNRPVVYVEHIRPRLAVPSTDCLRRRNALEVRLKQLRFSLSVWIATRPSAHVDWCIPRGPRADLPRRVSLAFSGPFKLTVKASGGRAVHASVTALRELSMPEISRPAATGRRALQFESPGWFLGVVYSFTNLGPGSVTPSVVNAVFRIGGAFYWTPRGARATIASLDQGIYGACGQSVPAFGATEGLVSPMSQVRPGQTVKTFALYSLPAAVGFGPVPRAASSSRIVRTAHLRWVAPSLGAAMALTARPR